MSSVSSLNKQKYIQNLHLAHANTSSELFDLHKQTEDRPLGKFCKVNDFYSFTYLHIADFKHNTTLLQHWTRVILYQYMKANNEQKGLR